jgi:acyl-CoA thioester hydrolase
MKKAGISYAQLEKQGIGLPVREMKITYYQAARYDELIEVETSIKDMPTNRIRFEYKIYREDTLLAEAETTLFCMDKGSLKPIRMPAVVQESLSTFFN